MNEVPHAGSTDPLIIRDVLLHHKVSPENIWPRMPQAIQAANEVIGDYLSGVDMKGSVLPGVHDLLSALREQGVLLGLVTGNLEHIGWSKLEAAGIRSYFETGAFSGEIADRSKVLESAILAAEQMDTGSRFQRTRNGDSLSNVYHVGDASSDMKAARAVGAKGIGVLTGLFNAEQLEKAEPHAVLDGLHDIDGFMKAIETSDTFAESMNE